MKTLKYSILCALVALMASLGYSQTALPTTTLSSAVTTPTSSQPAGTSIVVASATNITAGNSVLFIDREMLFVEGVSASGGVLKVTRGYQGTLVTPHASGATVYIGTTNNYPYYFLGSPKFGTCTATNENTLPEIVTSAGVTSRGYYGWIEDCFGSTWQFNDNVPRYALNLAPQAVRSVTSGTGTAGNASSVISQAGGGNTASGGTAGAGGAMTVGSGAGGAASTGAATGGAGGALNVTAGAGGGTITGGTGGAVAVAAGAGGAGSTTAGTGGAASVTGGAAPSTAGTAGVGGAASVTGGAGSADTGSAGTGGAGGASSLVGGAGGAASTGAATGGAGGAVSVTGGAGGGTITGGAGGAVTIAGGAGANGSTAGGTGGALVFGSGAAGTGGTGTVGAVTGKQGADTFLSCTTAEACTLQSNGTNQNTTISGSGTAGVVITGRTDAAAAASGKVGEVITNLVPIGSEVSLSNGTAAVVSTMSLTAGDWDVSAVVNLDCGSCTTVATSTQEISINTGTGCSSPAQVSDGSEAFLTPMVITTSSTKLGGSIPLKQINVSGTTTVCSVATATFSAGTMKGWGVIIARRRR